MTPVRIVMWSGPRNLSTAMMRSFGSRADTSVVDEPFYAAYLATTGIDHPMREEIIADGEPDWGRVAQACAADPVERPIRYEKHMTHHMIDGVGLDWMRGAAIAFLIRDPRVVAASYAAKREAITAADIGNARQAEIFDIVADMLGSAPPVIDAADVRAAPEAVLRKLCAALGIAWDPAMLSWPAGPHPSDGIWAKHWYAAVNASTGFAPPERGTPTALPALLETVADEARPHYERLARHRILP
jgi:hypothetical protein